MAGKSIIIIGAGVAGLTTGSYTQMNGYSSRIFEMHDKPGGLCTAWQRNGYTIDGCLHWLVGTAPGSPYRHLWDEVGALRGLQVIDLDQMYRIENTDGKVFNLYTDPDRLRRHMKEIAPEDSEFIDELANAIKKFKGFALPADKAIELYSVFDNLKVLNNISPFVGDLKKWGKMTIKQMALRFKNPFLREAWQLIWPPDFTALFIVLMIAWLAAKNAGYVIGGSMAIAKAMEKRYLELGGEIHYKSKVERVLVQDHRAVGVKLSDGSEHKADYVISAMDGHSTIFDLLEGKYLNEKVRGYYEKMPIFQPLVYVGLGVNRTFDDMPKTTSGLIFPIAKPFKVGKREQKWLAARIHNFDPTLAPAGKTVVTVALESDFAYWQSLHQEAGGYQTEKERILGDVIAALDARFPGLAQQIEAKDIATPYTFYRYTGNWQGCYEGFLMTPENVLLQMKKKLPGLEHFFMVGHWMQPGGGLPAGLMTGCHVTQVLCKHDNKHYCAICPK